MQKGVQSPLAALYKPYSFECRMIFGKFPQEFSREDFPIDFKASFHTVSGFDERILGGGDLVDNILKEAEDSHLWQLKAKRSGKTIEKLIEEECRKRGISPLELKGCGKRRKVNDTRGL